MKNQAIEHPAWCGREHYCQVGRFKDATRGEHRSEPLAIPTEYGSLILTAVGSDARPHLEVLMSVRLRPDHVQLQMRHLATEVDMAARMMLLTDPEVLAAIAAGSPIVRSRLTRS